MHELPPLRHGKRGTTVDLHHNILPRTARLKPRSTLLLEGAQPIPGSRFKALSNIDMLLHTMTHLMFCGDMADGLRDLVDIDCLVRDFAGRDATFWGKLLTRADQLDLNRPNFYALRYSKKFFDTPVPSSVLQKIADNAPPAPILRLMDRLVPRALFPQHPDFPSNRTAPARLLLYIRSHWISMPPIQLARHLTYKFYIGRLQPLQRFIPRRKSIQQSEIR
jgi:hypothetical protein